MQSVEAEGATIDEAIDNALDMLRVERDRVQIEIVTDAKRGLLGFGGKKARVRATLRESLLDSGEPSEQASGSGDPMDDENDVDGNRAEPGAPRNRDAGGDERSRRHRDEETVPVSKEAAERGCEFLRQALEHMQIEDSVEIEDGDEDGEVVLQVTGEASGVVIGRHGQTIDAIEYVVNRAVAREFPDSGHIVIDASGYRRRRRQSLMDMAQRLADKAKRERRTVTLNPLSPRDRRVVHIALKNERGITTRSHGAGLHRKLLIIPENRRDRQSADQR